MNKYVVTAIIDGKPTRIPVTSHSENEAVIIALCTEALIERIISVNKINTGLYYPLKKN